MTHEDIIEELREHGEPITVSDLADGLDISIKNLGKVLNSMSKDGLIVKVGTGKEALYDALEADEDELTGSLGKVDTESDEDFGPTVSLMTETDDSIRIPIAQVANDYCTTPSWLKSQCRLKEIAVPHDGLTEKEISEIIPAE